MATAATMMMMFIIWIMICIMIIFVTGAMTGMMMSVYFKQVIAEFDIAGEPGGDRRIGVTHYLQFNAIGEFSVAQENAGSFSHVFRAFFMNKAFAVYIDFICIYIGDHLCNHRLVRAVRSGMRLGSRRLRFLIVGPSG
jgi:hypothetical protein